MWPGISESECKSLPEQAEGVHEGRKKKIKNLNNRRSGSGTVDPGCCHESYDRPCSARQARDVSFGQAPGRSWAAGNRGCRQGRPLEGRRMGAGRRGKTAVSPARDFQMTSACGSASSGVPSRPRALPFQRKSVQLVIDTPGGDVGPHLDRREGPWCHGSGTAGSPLILVTGRSGSTGLVSRPRSLGGVRMDDEVMKG